MPGPAAVQAGPPPGDAHILRPLAGVRVLDLTRVIAGPVATRLLAALGADVLRIDPPRLPELSDQFVDTCLDKRSAEADLGLPENQGGLRDLIAAADVVVTGYRRGALDRFGLGARALLKARPGLAVVTLNSWGATGPWSSLRGFDSIVQAAAAVTLLAGRRRTGPGGTARLSLARTAGELFSLPGTSEAAAGLAPPDYRTMASSFGELRYVPPPLLLDGLPPDYRNPPPPYGSSGLTWA